MIFPKPMNSYGINLSKFSLPDELLDFQVLVTAAHIAESKRSSRPVIIETPVTNLDLFRNYKDSIEEFFEWLTDREIKFKFLQKSKTFKQQRLEELDYEF